jgi:hypothetical protein
MRSATGSASTWESALTIQLETDALTSLQRSNYGNAEYAAQSAYSDIGWENERKRDHNRNRQ